MLKVSTKQGSEHEVSLRAGLEQPNPPRERSHFDLGLPFNKSSCNLTYQFGLMGIDVALIDKNSIKRRVKHGEQNATNNC